MGTGLDGLDLCGGGAGASSLLMLPLGMGTAKFFWAEGFEDGLGGGGDAAPLTGWGSTSILADMADRRFRSRSSGGKFNGCVSGSYLLLRRDEWPASVECRDRREDLDGAGFASLWWETGREDLLVGDGEVEE